MTTSMNRMLTFVLLGLLSVAGTRAAAQPVEVPITADRWEALVGQFEIREHRGSQALVVSEGAVAVKGLTFASGTVEFDVDPTAMGAGLAFRARGVESLELLYFRPQPDCAARPDCVQYAPFSRGILLWDLFPQYQAAAPLRPNEWNHVKVVVSGRRMNVFVNRSASPTLSIGSLEGESRDGRLALAGPGAFANVRVAPGLVDGLSPDAEADPAAGDGRLVRQWQLGPFAKLPEGTEPTIAELPPASAGWRALAAERGGLLNISRVHGLPFVRPERAVTWLRTTISSSRRQSKKAAIGWSREVWVFVNGRRVYADKNLYQPPEARKAPDGRLSLENGSFVLPLDAGDNEVAVAVANNFFGWGLMLRLDDLEGIRLAGK